MPRAPPGAATTAVAKMARIAMLSCMLQSGFGSDVSLVLTVVGFKRMCAKSALLGSLEPLSAKPQYL